MPSSAQNKIKELDEKSKKIFIKLFDMLKSR
jgi:hypothetical protein